MSTGYGADLSLPFVYVIFWVRRISQNIKILKGGLGYHQIDVSREFPWCLIL